jgi:hypothetical protein
MRHGFAQGEICRLAILGKHLLRQRGIATITTELIGAIAAEMLVLDR